MKTIDKINKYVSAINEAKQAAIEASKNDDGGTCNLDTVVIDFSGWRSAAIQEISNKTGIHIGLKMHSLIWRGSCFVFFHAVGQGNNRSRMVEAAAKKLKELDIPATVYYQMD